MINKKYLYSLIVFLILVIAIFTLAIQKYSLLDITADNFADILELNESSVFQSGIDQCIPDKITLHMSHDYAPSDNYGGNGLNIKREENSKRLWITIKSLNTGLTYKAYYEMDDATLVAINISSKTYDPLLKEIAENLMVKSGFILKTSKLKMGNDIIIKETEDSFIIGTLYLAFEDPHPPLAINITSYGKRKFFKFLD